MSENERRAAPGAHLSALGSATLPPHPLEIVTRFFEEIARHVERHVGPIVHVHHEVVSELVHLDVLHVPPNPRRPCHTLVTAGMSELPMRAPEDAPACRLAELVLSLPARWRAGPEIYASSARHWPLAWLLDLARLPHAQGSWLWWGHTVAAAEPPRPLHASTRLCAWLLATSPTLPRAFHELRTATREEIHFLCAVPIHRAELDLVRRRGPEPLLRRFNARRVSDVLDPGRPSVCRPSRPRR